MWPQPAFPLIFALFLSIAHAETVQRNHITFKIIQKFQRMKHKGAAGCLCNSCHGILCVGQCGQQGQWREVGVVLEGNKSQQQLTMYQNTINFISFGICDVNLCKTKFYNSFLWIMKFPFLTTEYLNEHHKINILFGILILGKSNSFHLQQPYPLLTSTMDYLFVPIILTGLCSVHNANEIKKDSASHVFILKPYCLGLHFANLQMRKPGLSNIK